MLYNRFVDDTLAIFNSDKEVGDFFLRLNKLYPDWEFRMDGEGENQLSFMDVNIQCSDGDLVRSVFHKKTLKLYTHWMPSH